MIWLVKMKKSLITDDNDRNSFFDQRVLAAHLQDGSVAWVS